MVEFPSLLQSWLDKILITRQNRKISVNSELCSGRCHRPLSAPLIANVPLKDYIILLLLSPLLSNFAGVQSFLPRDNWLIRLCVTPPPPDPQEPPGREREPASAAALSRSRSRTSRFGGTASPSRLQLLKPHSIQSRNNITIMKTNE